MSTRNKMQQEPKCTFYAFKCYVCLWCNIKQRWLFSSFIRWTAWKFMWLSCDFRSFLDPIYFLHNWHKIHGKGWEILHDLIWLQTFTDWKRTYREWLNQIALYSYPNENNQPEKKPLKHHIKRGNQTNTKMSLKNERLHSPPTRNILCITNKTLVQ